MGAIAILAFGATDVFLRAPSAAPSSTAESFKGRHRAGWWPAGPAAGHAVMGGIAWQPWPKGAASELMITKSGRPDA